ncbi:MAG TPA: hypothetical protein VLK33_04990, partial [Terriglobales bacterium]|nr:hypothetical protein [Terriglobales bacterium]
MRLLLRYSKQYWQIVLMALFLAAINQTASLLDPLFFRHLVDGYANQHDKFSQSQFIRGAGLLLLAMVGAALVSRIAKNFQDY